MADLRELEIIHGKGTGILQKLVRESLAEHPQVSTCRFADFNSGGTGVTLVELKRGGRPARSNSYSNLVLISAFQIQLTPILAR